MLVANASLSYAYAKNDIMSIAGAFYALAAFAAVRSVLGRASSIHALAAAALAVALLATGGVWSVRSAGLHHILRLQTFRHRGDWALLPALRASEGRPVETDSQAWLIEALRNEALAMPAPNPRFYPRWAERLWGD